MKRHLFSIILAVLLLACASSSAFAETYLPRCDPDTGIYAASSTEKRNVFEFCDLFLYRLDRLKEEYSADATFDEHEPVYYGDHDFYEQFNLFSGENQYGAVLRAGDALIDVPDFTIDCITINLFDSYMDDDETTRSVFRAIMALSSLEYSSFDDYTFQMYYSLNPDVSMDSVFSALCIFNELIGPKLEDPSIDDKINKSTSAYGLLVYSGRYDYYLDYHEYEKDNGRTYFSYELVAIAK